jgi:hypothetical protein
VTENIEGPPKRVVIVIGPEVDVTAILRQLSGNSEIVVTPVKVNEAPPLILPPPDIGKLPENRGSRRGNKKQAHNWEPNHARRCK